MPYEDTLPLLASLLLLASVFIMDLAIKRTVPMGDCSAAGYVEPVAEWPRLIFSIQTDREQVELLLPELAKAVEKKDLETLLAAIAPESRPVQEQAKKAVLEVKPSQVLITRLNVDVLYDQSFPRAVADLLVRVAGKICGERGGDRDGQCRGDAGETRAVGCNGMYCEASRSTE